MDATRLRVSLPQRSVHMAWKSAPSLFFFPSALEMDPPHALWRGAKESWAVRTLPACCQLLQARDEAAKKRSLSSFSREEMAGELERGVDRVERGVLEGDGGDEGASVLETWEERTSRVACKGCRSSWR